MIVYPNAKINLGLNIISKRTDGYHNIETLFYPIGLSDALEIVFPEGAENQYQLKVTGNSIDVADEDNIIIKSLRKLQSVRSLPFVGVHLHKVVPTGAGLGGGSADAAFFMKHVNELLALGLSTEDLERLSATIGADCPFFISNKPAFATGIGDVLTPVEVSLSGLHMVLVKPQVSVPTKVAYSKVRPAEPKVRIPDILKRPVAEWRDVLVNDFEESVFSEFPVIAELKQKMYDAGALYASMSGSGSSVFGLFESKPQMEFGSDCFVWYELMR